MPADTPNVDAVYAQETHNDYQNAKQPADRLGRLNWALLVEAKLSNADLGGRTYLVPTSLAPTSVERAWDHTEERA